MNHDGHVDISDISCVADLLNGAFAPCTLEDVDIGGCRADGIVNVLDLRGVLAAFAGEAACCLRGDGVVQEREPCDDGNTQDDDGCRETRFSEGGTSYFVDRPGDGLGLDGDDGNPGTANRPFATIQRAMNLALPGDTVLIRSGTYNESIEAGRSGTDTAPITIAAGPGESVVLEGRNILAEGFVSESRSNLILQGLVQGTFRNA